MIPLNTINLNSLGSKAEKIFQSLGLVGFYALWVIIFRLITLTLITYFTISPTTRFQDINDAFSSNEVSLMGLSAALFTILLLKLNPLTSTQTTDVITRNKIEKDFLPGFIQGACLAGAVIFVFVSSGFYRYLGYFIQFEEAPLEIANVFLRMIALATLAYCEEFIFRFKFTRSLQKYLPDFIVAQTVALAYCFTKVLQFDLSWMHLVTLYLVSLCLHYRVQKKREFSKGAGLWAAVLIVFHPLLSLPIFGNQFSGILLIKYQTQISGLDLFNAGSSALGTRLLTGGAGGPISSFAFQLILLLDLGYNFIKRSSFRFRQRSFSSATDG